MAGRVGRPAVHNNVHQLRGNPSKKDFSASAMLGEFSPDAALPSLPSWVKGEARKEYIRLGTELERYRVISELDRGVLVSCACEWARIVLMEKTIDKLNASDASGVKGLVAKTPNGFRVMSVDVQLLRQAQTMYLKLISELGCSPSSRSRVKPTDAQMVLPGLESANDDPGKPTLANFR